MAPVIVYSSNSCPNCASLKKALGSKSIDYTEINVSEIPEQAEVLREKGFRALPVVNMGDDWLPGFTPQNFMKILNAQTQSTDQ